jgi:hypothetical protein
MTGSLIIVPSAGHAIIAHGTTVDQEPAPGESKSDSSQPSVGSPEEREKFPTDKPVEIKPKGNRPIIWVAGIVAVKTHVFELGAYENIESLVGALRKHGSSLPSTRIHATIAHRGPSDVHDVLRAMEKLPSRNSVILSLEVKHD